MSGSEGDALSVQRSRHICLADWVGGWVGGWGGSSSGSSSSNNSAGEGGGGEAVSKKGQGRSTNYRFVMCMPDQLKKETTPSERSFVQDSEFSPSSRTHRRVGRRSE